MFIYSFRHGKNRRFFTSLPRLPTYSVGGCSYRHTNEPRLYKISYHTVFQQFSFSFFFFFSREILKRHGLPYQ